MGAWRLNIDAAFSLRNPAGCARRKRRGGVVKEIVSSYLKYALVFGDKTFAMYLVLSMFLFSAILTLFYYRRATNVVGQIKKICKYFTSNAIRNNKILKRHWELYETTFIHDIDKRYKTTHEARKFFETDKILLDVVNARLWYFLPNILFLGGIVTLFMQLVYGFATFDISAPEAILESVKNSFLALAHGFVLLAISIVLTVFLIYFARSQMARMRNRIESLCDMLDTIFKISSMEERQIVLREYAKIFNDVIQRTFVSTRADASAPLGELTRELIDATRSQTEHIERINLALSANERATSESLTRVGAKLADHIGSSLHLGLQEIKHVLESNQPRTAGGNGYPILKEGLRPAEGIQIIQETGVNKVS